MVNYVGTNTEMESFFFLKFIVKMETFKVAKEMKINYGDGKIF